ncbi:MAG: OsmC family protein, partial [Chloroflexi bacterium]|nr:OsmC family protein [Chloroflexota bacterium]
TADTGFSLPLDASPKVGGDNEGFRPLELMALSLAGCTAMDTISILRKKRQDVTAFEVKVHTTQADQHPKVFTRAVIEYHVTGHGVNEKAVLRAIELSALRYCPAQSMLAHVFPIELKYFIFEDKGDDERVRVVSGGMEIRD